MLRPPSDDSTGEPRSHEWIVAVVLGYAFLAVAPIVLMMVVIAAKFQGLEDAVAMEHAQLARHLARGEGWVTSVLRPLSLAFNPSTQPHPDLFNAPLHPLLLAAFFRAAEPTDRIAAFGGAITWCVAVWLTFAVARHWFNDRVAALAALLLATNVVGIAAATGGLPVSLAAVMVTLACWAAIPHPDRLRAADDLEAAADAEAARATETGRAVTSSQEELQALELVPPWKALAAGILAAAATLSSFPMFAFALGLGAYVTRLGGQRARTAAWYLGGLIGGLSPWLVYSARVTGSPFPTLFWYDLIANSGGYPGNSVWGLTSVPAHPLIYALSHPLQMGLKLLGGLGRSWREVPPLLGPPAVFLCFAVLFAAQGGRLWRRSLIAIGAGLVAVMVASSLFRPDPLGLFAWAPITCIAGAAAFDSWLRERVGPIIRGERVIEPQIAQALVLAALTPVICIPLGAFVLTERPGPNPRFSERLGPLALRIGENGIIMTDQPVLVAWHADRRAMFLPKAEQDLAALEKVSGPVAASYITPAFAQIPQIEQSPWWFWLTTPRGNYRGLVLAEPAYPEGMLRVRKPVRRRGVRP